MKDWQRRALNFEIKAIETFLGIKFEGSTTKDKQAFVDRYKQERLEVTSELLRQGFEDYKRE